ncbi:hypothetical protein ACUXCC_004423 [Cytobacillus horneckiae]|uniref:Methylthioribose kinase n=1 Tax=Cytobacillus horneckiae TaxID=549687 RepID=A0A2N0ZKG6_9BACI|nr:methylthioribose kinase [Cytobacillus horneckiae]MBN6889157.1 methylthioribose kinase [Cytobacillus horneckiae]MEC1156884.1 methylthioribose kinase [Cytobacillus horneckiae]MED2940483.1 methylthioribose kinase [Cytobacillus horneckiae]PKG30007.1 methylthioribose kinase [Cytobacillus horneckiae]
MIQRFIELGEGYSDIYELIEIAKSNKNRISHLMALHTTINHKDVTSLVVVLHPAEEGKFQPLYICREGIPNPIITPNKRYSLFADAAEELGHTIIKLSVKPSTIFAEKELYYQQLIGILRLNHYIPVLN